MSTTEEARRAVADPAVRGALKERRAAAGGAELPPARHVVDARDRDPEVVTGEVLDAVEETFQAKGSGQVDLSGEEVELPITRDVRITYTHVFRSQIAKLQFTTASFQRECLPDEEDPDKEVLSVRAFVQNRLKPLVKYSLNGDDIVKLIDQFTADVKDEMGVKE